MSKIRTILLVCLFAACGSRRQARPDAAPLGEDPSRRLTETECATAVDHAIALLASTTYADDMKSGRDGHIAECVKAGTLRDYRCLMGSKNLTELGGCPLPGSK